MGILAMPWTCYDVEYWTKHRAAIEGMGRAKSDREVEGGCGNRGSRFGVGIAAEASTVPNGHISGK